jgi:predicted ATP-grasp superfamily ATP-dependent carboligase
MGNLMLTAAGFQGAYNLVRELQKAGYRVIGTDKNKQCAAQFYCDRFFSVPPSLCPNNTISERFIKYIQQICKREKIDLVLPGSSYDAFALSAFQDNFPAKILISKYQSVRCCANKYHTYEVLGGKVDLPKYVYNHKGYYKKPLAGKGSKGIEFISGEDEDNRYLIMEKLEGEQIDVDVLSRGKELLLAICKTRERAYGGTLMEGEIVDRPEIIKQIKKILKIIPLDYLSVWQFIGGKLIEINPRIAGAVMDYNIVLMAINLALNKITPEKIKQYKPPYKTRIARYLDQIIY